MSRHFRSRYGPYRAKCSNLDRVSTIDIDIDIHINIDTIIVGILRWLPFTRSLIISMHPFNVLFKVRWVAFFVVA